MPVASKIALAFGMAGLTGLMAQARIRLPFTPVPVTGQVLAVLLSGVLLGGTFGGLSQLIYVLLGVLGVPWFAEMTGGASILTGVTGGYLVGFVLAALLVGGCVDRFVWARRFVPQLGLMACAVGLIYACGAPHLAVVLRVGFREAVLMGVVPFAPFDAVKALVAASVSAALLPKAHDGRAMHGEG